MLNEIHTNFKREQGIRLADCLTAKVFYRLCWVYLLMASVRMAGCDRASAKDFHEIRAVFTRGVA